MSDFTTVTIDYNSGAGTDAAPVWTGTTIAFGGTSGANEFRFALSTANGTTTTPSASWPNVIKPGANTLVDRCWAFSADAVGLACLGYPTAAATAFSRAFRFNFDALGSPASAMQFSSFQDSADTTPTPGTQTANATNGSNIVNGQTTDTGNASYLKGEAYGSGFPAAGAQETPAAGSLTVTTAASDGTAGALVTTAAAWIPTHWQSLQGWVQYIQAVSVAKVTTAFFWYFNLAMWVGPNMQTGIMVFSVVTLQYTWT